jgi:acyl dehydratase
MPVREIVSLEELQSCVGLEVVVGDWYRVTQEQIDLFADATGDHQWIHVDVERAKNESPFGAPIAHGFLTLSLLPQLMSRGIVFNYPIRLAVNYGLNRLRFVSPVPAGSQIRLRAVLASLESVSGGRQLLWNVLIEREGSEKPCCAAEWLIRQYDELDV